MIDSGQWFALHSAYLRTAEWRAKHDAVMARDNRICQAALPCCTRTAEQVHHVTYRHWRHEPLFDLVAVCSACHVEITRQDRGREHAEQMVKSYYQVEEAARREQFARLRILLRAHDPKTLDPSALQAYRFIEREVERLEAELWPVESAASDVQPLTPESEVPAGGTTRDEDRDDRT